MRCQWLNGQVCVEVQVERHAGYVQVWDKALLVFTTALTPSYKYKTRGLILSNFEGLLFPNKATRAAFLAPGPRWTQNPLRGCE